MRLLRTKDYVTVPWKNGLGTTREILRHPDLADDFVFRLSIAEVTQSCEFSAFPGYDRIIMLLDGGGFELHFVDGHSHTLTTRHTPFRFDGGSAASCIVADGPSQDLNLMVRQGVAKADCSVMAISGQRVLAPVPGTVRLLVGLADSVAVQAGSDFATLSRWDTVCMAAPGDRLGEVVCEAAGAEIFHAVIVLGAGTP